MTSSRVSSVTLGGQQRTVHHLEVIRRFLEIVQLGGEDKQELEVLMVNGALPEMKDLLVVTEGLLCVVRLWKARLRPAA